MVAFCPVHGFTSPITSPPPFWTTRWLLWRPWRFWDLQSPRTWSRRPTLTPSGKRPSRGCTSLASTGSPACLWNCWSSFTPPSSSLSSVTPSLCGLGWWPNRTGPDYNRQSGLQRESSGHACPLSRTCTSPESGNGPEASLQIHHSLVTTCSNSSPLVGAIEHCRPKQADPGTVSFHRLSGTITVVLLPFVYTVI